MRSKKKNVGEKGERRKKGALSDPFNDGHLRHLTTNESGEFIAEKGQARLLNESENEKRGGKV
jgi:hypothetical protein